MRPIEISKRPWGKYSVLINDFKFKLKIIEVNPGHRLSYQFHNKRSEVWVVVNGSCEVTIDGEIKNLKYGDSISIYKKSKHRIYNNSKNILQFVEVQTGSYFGEDDIVRIEDDYNRVK